jgi:hypothetical protein
MTRSSGAQRALGRNCKLSLRARAPRAPFPSRTPRASPSAKSAKPGGRSRGIRIRAALPVVCRHPFHRYASMLPASIPSIRIDAAGIHSIDTHRCCQHPFQRYASMLPASIPTIRIDAAGIHSIDTHWRFCERMPSQPFLSLENQDACSFARTRAAPRPRPRRPPTPTPAAHRTRRHHMLPCAGARDLLLALPCNGARAPAPSDPVCELLRLMRARAPLLRAPPSLPLQRTRLQ